MRRILLLDDNPLVGRVWAAQLARDGFHVLVADEVGEALEAVEKERPALVLVDSALPEMDGFEFCRRLLEGRKGSPAVVMLTTNINTTDERAKAHACGAADVWIKYDLNPGELARRIRELLGLSPVAGGAEEEITLADALVLAGIISEKQLFDALKLQFKERLNLDDALLRLGAVDCDGAKYLREFVLRADYVDLSLYRPDPQALALVEESAAIRLKLLPLSLEEGQISIVMADPNDVTALDYLTGATGRRVRPFYAPLDELQRAQLLHYGAREIREKKPQAATGEKKEDRVMGDLTITEILSERPVVEMVDVALMKAMEVGASDIHVEPSEDAVHLRFRIDGILHELYTLPASVAKSLVSRIKVLGSLNLAESRLPQDGRFQTRFPDGFIDYRVSTVPVLDGEKVVIRVLDRRSAMRKLEDLGFEADRLDLYRRMAKRPYGMLLITGPTGSGKTTTLYATLNWLKNPGINVVSIEDPVEFKMEGVNQIPVNPRIGLTFSNILRTVLRQDPNIIMVGEIRDIETAELAVQAALTGHLVLGTLHTNDAPTALMRLVDMGLPPYLVNATVNGIVAQRLMRRICTMCKEEHDFAAEAGERALPEELEGVKLFRGKGCNDCRGTGYRGRVAIYELMPVSKALRALVLEGKDADLISSQVRREGMLTLRDEAVRKIRKGETTVQEMWRVTLDEG